VKAVPEVPSRGVRPWSWRRAARSRQKPCGRDFARPCQASPAALSPCTCGLTRAASPWRSAISSPGPATKGAASCGGRHGVREVSIPRAERLASWPRLTPAAWAQVHDLRRPRDLVFWRGQDLAAEICLPRVRPGDLWVDVGCGPGHLTATLAAAGAR